MTRKILILLCCLLPQLAPAQKKNKQAMKAAATISAGDLQRHLYTIASKEMQGRNTPSPGLEKAAAYIETHFRSLGLLPGNNGSYRQTYPLYKDSLVSAGISIKGTAYVLNKDFQPVVSNYNATMRFSEVVFAGYGISDEQRDDYKDLDVSGKLVVILNGVPEGYKEARAGRGIMSPSTTNGKMATASKKGAAALVMITPGFPRKAAPLVSNWNMRGGYLPKQNIFTFNVSAGVAETLMGLDTNTLADKENLGKLFGKTYQTETELSFTKSTLQTMASNVLGLLEGADLKDEYVLITAHYDHLGMTNDTTIYYGADDDGSGTTGILELAEAFAKAKKAGRGPRRSILFMTVSGEEKGLWGSEYYTSHPVYPLEKTSVDLNIDMIGRIGREYKADKDSANYIFIIGDDKLSTDLATITDQVNNLYVKMKLDRKYNDPKDPNRYYYRSDHYNFAEKGVPVIFYFNGTHADYHRPTDTPDKINYPLMASRVKLVFFTAWEMANRNEMLKRDIIMEKPKGF